ncbi:hypothetical protein JCM19000A_00950 [Silvimonas sp. JCM 19000]
MAKDEYKSPTRSTQNMILVTVEAEHPATLYPKLEIKGGPLLRAGFAVGDLIQVCVLNGSIVLMPRKGHAANITIQPG